MGRNRLKSYLALAFVLFFGGIFTAGLGLGIFDGVVASLLVMAGVLFTVSAPVVALLGAAAEEATMVPAKD